MPVAVLMQATSLPFIVAATAVGLALDVVTPANAAALIAAGLLSVVIFPALSLVLLRRDPKCSRAIDEAMAARTAAQRRRQAANPTPTANHPATT